MHSAQQSQTFIMMRADGDGKASQWQGKTVLNSCLKQHHLQADQGLVFGRLQVDLGRERKKKRRRRKTG
jgi:hypothetical protein